MVSTRPSKIRSQFGSSVDRGLDFCSAAGLLANHRAKDLLANLRLTRGLLANHSAKDLLANLCLARGLLANLGLSIYPWFACKSLLSYSLRFACKSLSIRFLLGTCVG